MPEAGPWFVRASLPVPLYEYPYEERARPEGLIPSGLCYHSVFFFQDLSFNLPLTLQYPLRRDLSLMHAVADADTFV